MHKYFQMSKCYEGRKIQTCAIMDEVLAKIECDKSRFEFMDRRHDVADAICMIIFYCGDIQRLYDDKKQKQKTIAVNGSLDRFRFKGRSSGEPIRE